MSSSAAVGTLGLGYDVAARPNLRVADCAGPGEQAGAVAQMLSGVSEVAPAAITDRLGARRGL